MEFNKPKVDSKGKLVLIDPNPPERDLIPAEDLFIYVRLVAESKDRSVILNNSGKEGGALQSDNNPNGTEVNFIATKIDTTSEDSDGKFTSYATTDYTDIGGLRDSSSGMPAVVEGFGIESINITYNASFIPQVNIKFIDLRGASLFDVIDKENRKSPYSMFFKMPYPVFRLTVKGYYGKPVTYCLHMLKWSSSFNADNGNFEINANFVGYQGAFLSDIKLQNVIGVTNTDSGREKLAKLKIKDGNGGETSTPPISSFLNEISRLEIDLADIKVSSKESDNLKKLNTTQVLLKNLSTIVGRAIPSNGRTEGDIKKGKSSDKMFGSGITSPNFKTNKNLIPYRDLIIIKKSDEDYFEKFKEIADEYYKTYENYILELDESIKTQYTLENFNIISKKEGVFQTIVNQIYEKGTTLFNIAADDTEFNPENSKDRDADNLRKPEDFIDFYQNKKLFRADETVIVYDFTDMREEITQKVNDIEDIIKEKKEETIKSINNQLKEKLTFNPTIKNVFEILMNNTQVMMEELYDVSYKAEVYGRERYNALSSYETDNNSSKIVYAWPDVVENDDKGESKKKWLGSIYDIDPTYFPEIDFVEKVVEAYTKANSEMKEIRKALSNLKGNTLDNWVPVNPIDYSNNPYAQFSGNWDNVVDGVPEDLYKMVVQRAMVLRGFTNVNDNKILNSYGTIEGAIAADNISTTKKKKDLISENFTSKKAIDYCLSKNIISREGQNYILKNKTLDNDFSLNNISQYIIGPDAKRYIRNKNKVSENIKDRFKSDFQSISNIGESFMVDNGIKYMSSNYLYSHNISYLVWGEQYKNDIIKPKSNDINYKLQFKENSKLFKNIRQLNLESGKEEESIEKILNNLGFLPFDEVTKKYITSNNFPRGKVLSLPKLYIAWLGMKNTNSDFRNYYREWLRNDGEYLLSTVQKKVRDEKEIKEYEKKLLSILQEEDKIVVTTPNINSEISIDGSALENYLNNFSNGFTTLSTEIDVKEINDREEERQKTTNNNDLKLSIYNYFKTIFDKWIGGSKEGKVFNECAKSEDQKNLIDQFKFINRAWDDIGDEAVCNLTSVINLAPDTRLNLYLYISKILRDSNFLLQILPSFINFKDSEDIKNMFMPVTDISDGVDTSPTYVCILSNGASKTLDISENDVEYQYANDALNFDFKDGSNNGGIDVSEPSDGEAITDKLVAFRVAFGAENQSIFKGVNLSQDENSPTGEYYKQLSNLVDKRGKTQSILQGNDLYDLFSTRAYKCGVSSLGNMNIQPLMMFQLDNVPFFRGAYQILSVEHSISANDMGTSFTGLRQSTFNVPIVKEATTFMDIDFNEVDDVAQRLSVGEFLRNQKTINNNSKVLNPTGKFVLSKINAESLSDLGVGGSDEYRETLARLMINYFNNYGVITNSDVCNFLSQCMHESAKFRITIEIWGEKDGTKWQKRYEPDSKKSKELGNTQSGDGKRFRGRGFIQITGKVNYELLQNSDRKLFENITSKTTEELDEFFNLNSDKGIERSLVASLIWWKENIVDRKLDLSAGDIPTVNIVTKRVNGGYHGIEDRIANFEKCLDVFGLRATYGLMKPLPTEEPTQ